MKSMSRWSSSIIVSTVGSLISTLLVDLVMKKTVPWLVELLEPSDRANFVLSCSVSPIQIFLIFLFMWLLVLGRFNVLSIKLVRRIFSRETVFDWDDITIGTLHIMEALKNTGYIPTHIIGIGRGGAIIGSLISGNLLERQHIHFTMFERKFSKDEMGMRQTHVLSGAGLGEADLSKVLLVAGDAVTGLTASRFKDFLQGQGAKEVRFVAFASSPSPALVPDYSFGTFESDQKLFFPWMISSNYSRYVKNGEYVEKI